MVQRTIGHVRDLVAGFRTIFSWACTKKRKNQLLLATGRPVIAYGMEARDTPEVETDKLSESLRAGATLPASWYTAGPVFRQESRAIFSRYWQYACRVDEVAHPGDYRACRAGNVPVVVVRNLNNEIAAFVNVCGHRGAEIVLDGSRGNRNTLQCHYHAWT